MYLEMRISGKTGLRVSVSTDALSLFQQIIKRKSLKADDLLFGTHHRDAFRELLEASKLRHDDTGGTRNLKALRLTGLMLTILKNPNVNLVLLARNVGTSAAMLDTFYLKKLSVDMRVEALL
jgi:hypothetical protein